MNSGLSIQNQKNLITLANKTAQNKTPAKVDAGNNSAQDRPEKNKKLILTAAGLAILGVTAVGIALSRKQKGAKLEKEFEKGVKNFFDSDNKLAENIEFSDGKAIDADKNGFSGIMKTITNNDNKITIEFKDGLIQKAISSGTNNFEKNYSYSNELLDKVTIVQDGKTKEIHIAEIKNAVETAKEKYNLLMQGKSNYRPEDFTTDYLNKTQIANVDATKAKTQKLVDISTQYAKDAIQTAYQKELEFREKVPQLQEIAEKAKEMANGTTGLILDDGTQVIRQRKAAGILDIIYNENTGKLEIKDYGNKTYLKGSFDGANGIFEPKIYQEGVEIAADGTQKIEREFVRNSASNAYNIAFSSDEDNRFLTYLGSCKEGITRNSNGTEETNLVISLKDEYLSANNIYYTIDEMKEFAKGNIDMKALPMYPCVMEKYKKSPTGATVEKCLSAEKTGKGFYNYFENLTTDSKILGAGEYITSGNFKHDLFIQRYFGQWPNKFQSINFSNGKKLADY